MSPYVIETRHPTLESFRTPQWGMAGFGGCQFADDDRILLADYSGNGSKLGLRNAQKPHLSRLRLAVVKVPIERSPPPEHLRLPELSLDISILSFLSDSIHLSLLL